MFNRFTADSNLPHSTLNDLSHLFFPIQNSAGLFILINIDLKFIQKLFVDLLILMDKGQSLVNFSIKLFIGINTNKMLFSKFFFFCHNIVQFNLLSPNIGLNTCKFVSELFSFGYFISMVGSIVACIDLVLICLLKKIVMGDPELLNIIAKSIEFVLGSFSLVIFLFEF